MKACRIVQNLCAERQTCGMVKRGAFRIENSHIAEFWVLGDLISLDATLKNNAAEEQR